MKTTENAANALSRRSFVQRSLQAGAAVLATGSSASLSQAVAVSPGGPAVSATGAVRGRSSSFVDLLRPPDRITAYPKFSRTFPDGEIPLERRGESWVSPRVQVQTRLGPKAQSFELTAPADPVVVVHVRWRQAVDPTLKVLGDAWERSYGELGWRNMIPERGLPWYFATYDGDASHGYGVQTDARALCFWQVDTQGVSLWLNVANGGEGVLLGQRTLSMATVVSREGSPGEDSVSAVTELCKAMCARVSRPLQRIYGTNDWNYSYGQSTSASIVRDTEFIAELSPSAGVRPFSVVDAVWTNGTKDWPDMGVLAGHIKQRDVRPGIWIRPLEAPEKTAAGLLLPGVRFGNKKDRAREFAYDPTVPEAQELILAKVRQVADWGYELVKHDFSTYDLLGQWGSEMGPQPTLPGWSLHDRTRTNAEVIADLYAMIRRTAGDRVLIDGCNTVGHLGQGVFDLQRTGDDTSGRQWERTRRMGVNTAAFRLPQHGTFFCLDADLVGITDAIPWEQNRQWLDMLARSGAVTMISPGPPARGEAQRSAIREAFALAAAGGLGARPVDWLATSVPAHWRSRSANSAEQQRTYDWSGADGASAFLGP